MTDQKRVRAPTVYHTTALAQPIDSQNTLQSQQNTADVNYDCKRYI